MIAKFLLALLMFFAVAVLGAKQPIGIRADNPGNIHGTNWRAWEGGAGTDEYHYLRFRTPLDGLRAMRIILTAYQERHGIRSIAGICNRWVRHPRGAAQVAAFKSYMLAVVQRSGFWANQRLNLEDEATEIRVAQAIVYAEQGQQPYPAGLYRLAFERR